MNNYYDPQYKPPPIVANNPHLLHYIHRTRWWSNLSAGIAIFVFLAVIGCYVFGVFTLNNSRYKDTLASYTTSGEIKNTPYKIRLDGAAPLAMTLPNDLSAYVAVTYSIFAGTAQAHTITIPAGTYSTTFDGTNTIATFGGAVGDGIMIEVIGKDKIVIISNTNVAFS